MELKQLHTIFYTYSNNEVDVETESYNFNSKLQKMYNEIVKSDGNVFAENLLKQTDTYMEKNNITFHKSFEIFYGIWKKGKSK